MRPKTTTLLAAVGACVLLAAGLGFWVWNQSAAPAYGLTVPDGFEVELAAGPPLVERPITVDFDEEGRLYVAESSGSNDPVEQQLKERPHSILRLEDSDGDGRFDQRTVFADKMMFPEGTMWYDGALYVAAPPSIWRLEDTDGDGVADRREEWFNGKTLTHCANDLHGPYLSPDGWIYWCKGGFAEQTYERPGKPPLVTRAGHIFRRRPGDSLVEPVLTGGMDNPVDVAFTPEGERILTATFLQHPELGRRDGLIHAIYGGIYGKVHRVIDDHPQTGDLLTPMTHFGPAAPCGLTSYTSQVFGKDFQNNVFACLFNLHKVTRHILEPSGATFQSHDSDFLVSSSQDFHPTDVVEDADGSLLVVDTGGWYKLCCPTSQLAKPDVLGGIYRIRRKGAARIDDPRGLRLAWEEMGARDLAALLDDPRPGVRNRAIHQLAKRGAEAAPVLHAQLKEGRSVEARRNAVWALTRIDDPQARAAVHDALKDSEDSVRHAATHSASVWRDRGALAQLLDTFNKGTPHLRRAAAEAIGRIGDGAAVPKLLAAAETAEDEVLSHSLIYALIEIGDPAATARGLDSPSPKIKRAALIALDQMEGGKLTPKTVLPLLTATDPLLKETGAWIAGRHPEWGGALAGFYRDRLAARNLNRDEREELQKQLVRFAGDEAIQALLSRVLHAGGPKETHVTALRVIAGASLKKTPEVWNAALARVLSSRDPELLREAVAAARAAPPPGEGEKPDEGLHAALLQVGRDTGIPAAVRLEALAVARHSLTSVEPGLFDFLLSHLDSSQPVEVRGAAARVLGDAPLTLDQQMKLADALKDAGSIELPTLLGAFHGASDEGLGRKLIAALENSKGLSSLRADLLEKALEDFPNSVRDQAEALLASLDADREKQKAHLEELLGNLPEGDVRRGQAIFKSAEAACASCHTIGYLGGKVGPDLTRIGEIRNERDLLESVVYPSASFVRSYEPVVVETKSGDLHNGVILKETDDDILLATGVNMEERVRRAEIVEIRPGAVSVMPSGLDEQLTRQQLADLIAFLKAAQRRRG